MKQPCGVFALFSCGCAVSSSAGGTTELTTPPPAAVIVSTSAPPAYPPGYTPPPPPKPIDVELSYQQPVYTEATVSAPGENISNVDVFYDQLGNKGTWFDDPGLGYVFTPEASDFRPYSNGHWANTPMGLVWVSADPWGWATDHYGRWAWAGRWVWRPDVVWAPAWVQWREGDDFTGWVALGVDEDDYVPNDQWSFIDTTEILAPDPRNYYVQGDTQAYFQGTAAVRSYQRSGSVTWPQGPSPHYLQMHNVQGPVVQLQLAEYGRVDAGHLREWEDHARSRQSEWAVRHQRDEQVRKELDARHQRGEAERQRVLEQHRQYQEQLKSAHDDAARARLEDDHRKQLADEQRARDAARERQKTELANRKAEQDRRFAAEHQQQQHGAAASPRPSDDDELEGQLHKPAYVDSATKAEQQKQREVEERRDAEQKEQDRRATEQHRNDPVYTQPDTHRDPDNARMRPDGRRTNAQPQRNPTDDRSRADAARKQADAERQRADAQRKADEQRAAAQKAEEERREAAQKAEANKQQDTNKKRK